jgi:hypothetical protein
MEGTVCIGTRKRLTVMGETAMNGLSDRGSIPLSSMLEMNGKTLNQGFPVFLL